MKETLEHLDLREPVEQRDRIDRIGRRAETPAFSRLAEPLALLRNEDVRIVVAGGGAIEAAKASITSMLVGCPRRAAT